MAARKKNPPAGYRMAAPRRARGDTGGGLGGASNVSDKRSGDYDPTRVGRSGGIGASNLNGAPAADAANYASGGKPGKDAPAAGTGSTRKQAFGVTSGSNKPDRRGRAGRAEPASTAGNSKSTGSGMSVLADHIPGHTFASSTLPRSDRQTGASAPITPADRTNRTGTPGARLSAVTPTPSREMAAPQKKFPKKGIIKPSRKGLFTAKAKAAGMSVQAYANSVMANPSSHDPQTVKQANFARNFGGAAKKKGG